MRSGSTVTLPISAGGELAPKLAVRNFLLGGHHGADDQLLKGGKQKERDDEINDRCLGLEVPVAVHVKMVSGVDSECKASEYSLRFRLRLAHMKHSVSTLTRSLRSVSPTTLCRERRAVARIPRDQLRRITMRRNIFQLCLALAICAAMLGCKKAEDAAEKAAGATEHAAHEAATDVKAAAGEAKVDAEGAAADVKAAADKAAANIKAAADKAVADIEAAAAQVKAVSETAGADMKAAADKAEASVKTAADKATADVKAAAGKAGAKAADVEAAADKAVADIKAEADKAVADMKAAAAKGKDDVKKKLGR